MMTSHLDDRAELFAAMRADELLEAGDMDGRRVWLRVPFTIPEAFFHGKAKMRSR